MKLLKYIYSREELHRLRVRLTEGGIPTYEQRAGSPWIGPYKVALFVVFDYQLTDAMALLEDPNHVVIAPINSAAYESVRDRQDHRTILIFAFITFLLVATIFSLILLVARTPLIHHAA
jgi:hypothetical protein